MKQEEIRKKTCLIISKNRRYMKGWNMLTDSLEWTWSAYEAWRTRDMEEAENVARATGGVMVLFNPIVNKTKVIGA